MPENADQNNSEYRHFSGSDYFKYGSKAEFPNELVLEEKVLVTIKDFRKVVLKVLTKWFNQCSIIYFWPLFTFYVS